MTFPGLCSLPSSEKQMKSEKAVILHSQEILSEDKLLLLLRKGFLFLYSTILPSFYENPDRMLLCDIFLLNSLHTCVIQDHRSLGNHYNGTSTCFSFVQRDSPMKPVWWSIITKEVSFQGLGQDPIRTHTWEKSNQLPPFFDRLRNAYIEDTCGASPPSQFWPCLGITVG